MKYQLKKPLTLAPGHAPLSELTFREEVTAGDLRGVKLRALEDPITDDMMKIAAHLCAQPEHVLYKLGLADMTEVLKIVGDFLGAGLEIGTEPSL